MKKSAEAKRIQDDSELRDRMRSSSTLRSPVFASSAGERAVAPRCG